MKRLRKKNPDSKIRYFHAGEYGEQENRPHHHACLFGYNLPDRKLWKMSDDIRLDTSDYLDATWGKGFSTVGDVTFESAAYVARYIMKKVNGDKAELIDPQTGLKHYDRVHLFTGEITSVLPEYTTMSRGGSVKGSCGIGATWLDTYVSDVYPADHVIINGHETRPPRYYDSKFEILDPDAMEEIKQRREKKMERYRQDNTPERLASREQVKLAQLSQLKRGLTQ